MSFLRVCSVFALFFLFFLSGSVSFQGVCYFCSLVLFKVLCYFWSLLFAKPAKPYLQIWEVLFLPGFVSLGGLFCFTPTFCTLVSPLVSFK